MKTYRADYSNNQESKFFETDKPITDVFSEAISYGNFKELWEVNENEDTLICYINK